MWYLFANLSYLGSPKLPKNKENQNRNVKYYTYVPYYVPPILYVCDGEQMLVYFSISTRL